ncbi:MAG: DUF4197 domain-containing protein [Sphingobium sp.]|mgnify:CR=1 FL=1|nr:DUF4197 domain-containing protein [Sphingobium sp.]MBP6112468.1 DUF4197 domain-containing protein [Sphingobium sp.]MBP8671004.1 DUF4197 domain-containing protein [Sphingobium sp.]MBP9158158.1 DUF4197 domain-containing protein [Sphingobium sp.]
MERRQFLMGGSALALLALGGCSQGLGYSLTEAIRRLLSLSSQRALARLMAQGGFYDSQIARITLPDQLGGSGGGSLLSRMLLSSVVRDRLLKQVNRAAEKGAERAAPVIADAILSTSPQDAAAIIRAVGTPAATNLLQQHMGTALISAMLPGVDDGLKLFDNQAVTEALRLATGINFVGLRDDVTRKASDAIFAEMGREEMAIRADPRSSGDPVLIAALTAASAL